MRIRLEDDERDGDVQMAPLIDCVFLLLVFFLVATTLQKPKKVLDIQLAGAATANLRHEKPGTIAIVITADGKVHIDGVERRETEIKSRFDVASKASQKPQIMLEVDQRANFSSVARTLNLCNAYGLNDIHFRTKDR